MSSAVCFNLDQSEILSSGNGLSVWISLFQIVFGSNGVLRGISSGKCFVEMSTIDEETVQDVAEVRMETRGHSVSLYP